MLQEELHEIYPTARVSARLWVVKKVQHKHPSLSSDLLF